MTQEEAEELIKRMSQHGGQIIVQDPRMSGLINWFVGAVGIIALGVMAWGVNSLNELVDLLLADLSTIAHMLDSSADEVVHFLCVQAVAVVLVELSENSINCRSQLVVSVGHIFQSDYYTRSL